MAKQKAGLHKEISEILDGVQIPEKNSTLQTQASAPELIGYVPPEPLPRDLRIPLGGNVS